MAPAPLGIVEGGSCPLSPLAQQRGKAVYISSVTVTELHQHLLPLSVRLTVPAASALLTETS